jgi:hypothetical protein
MRAKEGMIGACYNLSLFKEIRKTMSMSRLHEAIGIFLKYGDVERPTHCEHDELIVCVDPSVVSAEDIQKLDELGFFVSEDSFKSFRYGSA